MIQPCEFSNIKQGATLIYNDGRAGHTAARAVVVSVNQSAVVVQFDDRADTTTIRTSDRAWLDFLTIQPAQTMREFFARADVQSLQAIQKTNPPSSKAHQDTTDKIHELAVAIGAGEFFGS